MARGVEAMRVSRDRGYVGPGQVVGNAVDAELFQPMNRRACREAMGVDGFVVGYIGRWVEEKGIVDLLAAIARCPANVNTVIVGSGPLQSTLEWHIRRLGLLDRADCFRPGR